MNFFFITGSSQGLGKSLVQLLLKDETNFVFGFARNCTIQHKNYHHITLDFSDVTTVSKYNFPVLSNPEKIVLINNAGIVGDINHLGNLDPSKVIETFNVNLVTPTILINAFISSYKQLSNQKLIINISSGAGRSAIDGWSVYCASKAGIDMLSQVNEEESDIDQTNLKVISLAPGIIDTNMQEEIRASKQTAFSNITRFIDYKKDGALSSPKNTAQKVLQFIYNPDWALNVLSSVRDLPE